MTKRSREERDPAALFEASHIAGDSLSKKRKVEKTNTNGDFRKNGEKSKISKQERRNLKRLRKLEALQGRPNNLEDVGRAIETQESERAAAKAARKAEKAQAKADGPQEPNGAGDLERDADPLMPEVKAKRKANRKAEKERKKTQQKKGKNGPANGYPQSVVQNGVERSKLDHSSPEVLPYQGYHQDPELTALPDEEIQAFLASNFITIKDPSSTTPLRPITQFSYLPKFSQSSSFSSFKSPTPIQASAWPFLLSGRDVIGIAETGSGKTLAFGIPCIRSVSSSGPSPRKRSKTSAQAVIISPTRELAVQIHTQIEAIATPARIHSVCVYGGVPKDPQRTALAKANIIVATPGRLMDLIEERSADLSAVQYLVLDEADRMLEKGFEDAIRKIISTTPSTAQGRQTLMFTATCLNP